MWTSSAVLKDLPVEVRLVDGAALAAGRNAAGAILIKSRRALASALRNPSLGFAQGYAEGEIEVEGDLTATLCKLLKTELAQKHPSILSRLKRLVSPNSVHRAHDNVMAHYDLGNDFYKLWLDESMTYSCAVFTSEDTPLRVAQETKCDLICRKLALEPGESFLDVGCGWGHLALRAAQEYGVESFGITQSPAQQQYAAEEIERNGLGGRCHVDVRDYRQLDRSFDKIASVGMLEHVGRPYLGRFFKTLAAALRPGGRCLIQVILQQKSEAITDFTNRIFPGGYFPTADAILHHAAAAGLCFRHADNLAEHYALTLRRWRENFDASRDGIEALTSRPFARWWQLYLAVSEAAFRVGRLQLFQFLFSKGPVRFPLARSYVSF
jgi:cyclopropane-fatty-acyl-phospholipid synthase